MRAIADVVARARARSASTASTASASRRHRPRARLRLLRLRLPQVALRSARHRHPLGERARARAAAADDPVVRRRRELRRLARGRRRRPAIPTAPLTPGGFHSFEHRWALAEAFRFHEAIGRKRVEARVRALAARLQTGLSEVGGAPAHTGAGALSAGLVCFEVDGVDPDERRAAAGSAPHRRERHAVCAALRPARPGDRQLPRGRRRGGARGRARSDSSAPIRRGRRARGGSARASPAPPRPPSAGAFCDEALVREHSLRARDLPRSRSISASRLPSTRLRSGLMHRGEDPPLVLGAELDLDAAPPEDLRRLLHPISAPASAANAGPGPATARR